MDDRFLVSMVVLKGYPLYTCMDCGARAHGDYVTRELPTLTAAEMSLAMRPRAHDMPVGWASYTEGFRCPEHVK